jgi:hypothetical protein
MGYGGVERSTTGEVLSVGDLDRGEAGLGRLMTGRRIGTQVVVKTTSCSFAFD